jgi:hypothetical protein
MSLKRFDLDVFSAQTELFQRTLHSDLFLFRFVVQFVLDFLSILPQRFLKLVRRSDEQDFRPFVVEQRRRVRRDPSSVVEQAL